MSSGSGLSRWRQRLSIDVCAGVLWPIVWRVCHRVLPEVQSMPAVPNEGVARDDRGVVRDAAAVVYGVRDDVCAAVDGVARHDEDRHLDDANRSDGEQCVQHPMAVVVQRFSGRDEGVPGMQ